MTSDSPTARIDSLIARLYTAAETLIESVADHIALEEAPLHHRAQALAAVDRFLERLEKRKAEIVAGAEEEEETQVYLEFICDDEDEEETETTGQKIFDRDNPPHLTPRFIEDVEGEEWYDGGLSPAADNVRVSPDRVREQITPYPRRGEPTQTDPALIDPSLYAGSW